MIYADGTALCQFLPGAQYFNEWNTFAIPQLGQIVTTQLGWTEFRQAAELCPREEREQVFFVVEQVKKRIPLIRFSEENFSVSAHAAVVLKPFAALHLGAAVADPAVNTMATYDIDLARVAALYQLTVVSPGLPAGWHNSEADASLA